MKYCCKCILPSTRPNLVIGKSGICNACESTSNKAKSEIDWRLRENQFISLVEENKSKSNWDCVIPVSGGKDSTWQVLMALKYGLKPLCLTWKTPGRNSIGQQNLDNLISLGVDHLDFTINPKVEKYFTKKSFIEKGIPLIPMHMAIYNLPIRIAYNFRIPLVIYGENSAIEYGGNNKYHTFDLTNDWKLNFGVNSGTTSDDWIDSNLSKLDLKPYSLPDFKVEPPKAIFLSHFFEWSVFLTRKIAQENGLKIPEKPKTGSHAFSDIDDEFLITVHHWLKWYKFGFTRTWDNLSLEIRSGKLSRKDAISRLISDPDKIPYKQIELFCEYIGISKKEFFNTADNFRNPSVWYKDLSLNWVIKNPLHINLNK